MTLVDKQHKSTPKKNTLLEIGDFLDGLLDDNRINQDDYDRAMSDRRSAEDRAKHVLHYLADLGLDDRLVDGHKLEIETLTLALSEQCGQEYYRIDPLKIDVTKITNVMSYAFTKRHHILAVEVTLDTVTIASAEPYIDSWVSDLEHVLQKKNSASGFKSHRYKAFNHRIL